jgi:hypothetical protein
VKHRHTKRERDAFILFATCLKLFFFFFFFVMLIEHFFSRFRPAAQIYSSLSLSPIKPALTHEAKTHTQRETDRHTVRRCHHQHGGRVRAFHRRGKLVIIIFPTFGFLDYRSRGFSRTRARARFFIRVFFFFFSERESR